MSNTDSLRRFTDGYCDFPLCNHVKEVGPANLGYSTGMTSDGLPFEVEICSYGKEEEQQKEIAFILPDLYVEKDDVVDGFEEPEKKATEFSYKIQIEDYSILPIGMVERGQEENLEIIKWYLDYIEEMGLVSFTGNMRSCAIFYLTDANGNDFVQARIGLITNGKVEAETDIQFRVFPHRAKKNSFKIIKK